MNPTPSGRWVALGVAVSVITLAKAQAPTAPSVFSSRVEAVYVDVFVTRADQPLLGLGASDFELRDNRVRQEIELLSAESRPVLAVLVFDTSSSMEGEKLVALRAAAETFLDALHAADQAALISLSDEIAWLAPPTTDKAAVRGALAQLRARGGTALFDALYAGVTLSATSSEPLIVLFTDGKDDVSWLGARQLQETVERSRALVDVVGYSWEGTRSPARRPLDELWATSEPEAERALRELAETSGGRLWEADSPARLREGFAAIVDSMHHRYVLRYQPTGVKREGSHRIEVRLKNRKGEVHARRGYWVAP
jgi:Ca-activated chloride channel homolog